MIPGRSPLDELNRRESARGDRESGIAQAQFPVVHVGVDYDCEVDTSVHSARECAIEIKQIVEAPSGAGAFDRLVAGLSPS